MINKSIFIGNYNNLDIFYNIDKKIIERSRMKKSSLNQSKLVGLILVSTPFIKNIDALIANIGLEARIIVLIICTIMGSLLGYFVTRRLFEQIKLMPMPMNENQFEDFYLENKTNLKVVKWLMIVSIFALLIETYFYIRWGIFIAAFIFLLNTFIVTSLILSGVHCRNRIFKELKNSYRGD